MKNEFRSEQEVALHLEAIKEATETLNKAVKATMNVIRKYDGKEFTRRITNEAQKAVDAVLGEGAVRVGFVRENGHREINFFLGKRHYFVPKTRFGQACSDVIYFTDELCDRMADWTGGYYDAVDADRFQTLAEQMTAYNARLVYKYADALEHFGEYRLLYANALIEFQKACGSINPLFLEENVRTTNRAVSRAWEEQADRAVANEVINL